VRPTDDCTSCEAIAGSAVLKLPYIVAEIGLNHDGDYGRACRLIWEAAKAGANAVKFQYVKADRLVARSAPPYFHQAGAPAETQHEFFRRSDALDRHDYECLKEECYLAGVDFLCTVFDVESIHWIAPLVPAFKVASADITNIPLLKAVASYKKPVYLSTGAATKADVNHAYRILRVGDGTCSDQFRGVSAIDIIPMHCVLSYPTPVDQANLGMIPPLQEYQGWPRGYSDHTLFYLDVLTTAWLLGATVIEKHFTLDKMLPGNDHYHSMDPTDLRALVAKLKELQAMIGDGEKRVLPIEEAARLNARQSWHYARDLQPGHMIQEGDVVLKRPAGGWPPERSPVGLTVESVVLADEPVTLVVRTCDKTQSQTKLK